MSEEDKTDKEEKICPLMTVGTAYVYCKESECQFWVQDSVNNFCCCLELI